MVLLWLHGVGIVGILMGESVAHSLAEAAPAVGACNRWRPTWGLITGGVDPLRFILPARPASSTSACLRAANAVLIVARERAEAGLGLAICRRSMPWPTSCPAGPVGASPAPPDARPT
jgi:hypothetical protein